MRRIISTLVVCIYSGFIMTACQPQEDNSSSIMVFAAASLSDAMEEIAEKYQRKSGVRVLFNFGGSNMLARQIEFSDKADIFLSANALWVDYLADKQLLVNQSKQAFLSNRLVFIANTRSPFELASAHDVVNLSFRFFSIGDPKAVPAGVYAKTYLSSVRSTQPAQSPSQSVWRRLEDKILPAPDVRAATAAVAALPDVIGMVYKTDALASADVRILLEPLLDEAPEIQYFGVLINRQLERKQQTEALGNYPDQQTGSEFLRFLSNPESKAIFRKHGFIAPDNEQRTAIKGSVL